MLYILGFKDLTAFLRDTLGILFVCQEKQGLDPLLGHFFSIP
jgi:hypothetical protein